MAANPAIPPYRLHPDLRSSHHCLARGRRPGFGICAFLGFARDALPDRLEGSLERLDVLFVDEVVQVSVADVLVVSQAAQTPVLLGDPQQLDNPCKGAMGLNGMRRS